MKRLFPLILVCLAWGCTKSEETSRNDQAEGSEHSVQPAQTRADIGMETLYSGTIYNGFTHLALTGPAKLSLWMNSGSGTLTFEDVNKNQKVTLNAVMGTVTKTLKWGAGDDIAWNWKISYTGNQETPASFTIMGIKETPIPEPVVNPDPYQPRYEPRYNMPPYIGYNKVGSYFRVFPNSVYPQSGEYLAQVFARSGDQYSGYYWEEYSKGYFGTIVTYPREITVNCPTDRDVVLVVHTKLYDGNYDYTGDVLYLYPNYY